MQSSDSNNFLYKIILIGDSTSGKSNVLARYIKNEFVEQSKNTIGVEFASKMLKKGDISVKLQIWKTAGQERYRAITSAHYRGAVGGLIIFDITNQSSFDNLKQWMALFQQEFHKNAEKSVKTILVGNKADLEEQRQVSQDAANAFAQQNNLEYIEVSAKTGQNIELVFDKLVQSRQLM